MLVVFSDKEIHDSISEHVMNQFNLRQYESLKQLFKSTQGKRFFNFDKWWLHCRHLL